MGRLAGRTRSKELIPQTVPVSRENQRVASAQAGRTLFTFTDYEISLLRDAQLTSIEGIGRERTLSPR